MNSTQGVPKITLGELAEHLGGIDPRTALNLASDSGLPMRGRSAPRQVYRFAWVDIFRVLHGIEPDRHPDLLEELKEPLWRPAQVADFLSMSAEALRKARSRGRLVLPPSIRINDRIELWRPRDIRRWDLGDAPTNYVKAKTATTTVSYPTANPGSRGGFFGAFLKSHENSIVRTPDTPAGQLPHSAENTHRPSGLRCGQT